MNELLKILKKRETMLSAIIVVFVVLVGLKTPAFLTYENATNILKSCAVTGIFSLGVLVIIISGGFDVSFTAIAQATEYLTVWILLKTFPVGNLFVAFVIAISFGTLLGLFNGYLIDHFKMPAIIITISMQNLIYGVMYVISKGKLLYEVPAYIWPLSNTRLFVQTAANGASCGLSMVTVLWFVMAILLSFLLKKTILGRRVFWVGGNAIAAERVGINMKKTTLFVYGLAGGIAGVAAIAHVSIVQTVIPNSIVGTEMSVIAAIILGGASITGGTGSVLGAFLGVLLFSVVSSSLTYLQISPYWYNVFIGAIIVFSLVLNAMQDLQHQKRKIRVKVSEEGVVHE